MIGDHFNDTGFVEIWPVLVMRTVGFLIFFSKTRVRGKNPKKPGTKKALGFYSVLVSPDLYQVFVLTLCESELMITCTMPHT